MLCGPSDPESRKELFIKKQGLLPLVHTCTLCHAYRWFTAALIILKRESRTEIWRCNTERRTVPWDEMFIRASPPILSYFLPLSAAECVWTNMHRHTYIQTLACNVSLPHSCVVMRGRPQLVNNEGFSYSIECGAWKRRACLLGWHLLIWQPFHYCCRPASLAQSSAKSIRAPAWWLLTAVSWQICRVLSWKPFNSCRHYSPGFCQPQAGKRPSVLRLLIKTWQQ